MDLWSLRLGLFLLSVGIAAHFVKPYLMLWAFMSIVPPPGPARTMEPVDVIYENKRRPEVPIVHFRIPEAYFPYSGWQFDGRVNVDVHFPDMAPWSLARRQEASRADAQGGANSGQSSGENGAVYEGHVETGLGANLHLMPLNDFIVKYIVGCYGSRRQGDRFGLQYYPYGAGSVDCADEGLRGGQIKDYYVHYDAERGRYDMFMECYKWAIDPPTKPYHGCIIDTTTPFGLDGSYGFFPKAEGAANWRTVRDKTSALIESFIVSTRPHLHP